MGGGRRDSAMLVALTEVGKTSRRARSGIGGTHGFVLEGSALTPRCRHQVDGSGYPTETWKKRDTYVCDLSPRGQH